MLLNIGTGRVSLHIPPDLYKSEKIYGDMSIESLDFALRQNGLVVYGVQNIDITNSCLAILNELLTILSVELTAGSIVHLNILAGDTC